MASPANRFSVYIHYPWCRHRCPYCDFAIAVAPPGEIPSRAYADAVIAELNHRASRYRDRSLHTIYLGGGTPSLWPADEIARVLSAARARFAGDPEEITIEANPSDCTPATLQAWLELGITRVSVGVQSFADSDLVVLGRDHRMGDGLQAAEAVREAGFDSWTVDLMLAVPNARRDPGIDQVARLGAPHVSVYELTIEERTPLAGSVRRGEVVPFDDDERAERYLHARERLMAAGYEHYEVSSYAQVGHRSRHNSSYWRLDPYLGVGNGAASLWVGDDGQGLRTTNLRSVGAYLAVDPGQAVDLREDISPAEMRRDRLWLGLRTADGVLAADVPGELADWLIGCGFAEAVDGRIQPTIRGFLHHDGIARRVVADLG